MLAVSKTNAQLALLVAKVLLVTVNFYFPSSSSKVFTQLPRSANPWQNHCLLWMGV